MKLSIDDLAELETLLTGNITFINEELLSKELLLSTESLLKNIDIGDTPFVALADTWKLNCGQVI
jgi:predicted nucleic acid-binding protein